MRRLVVPLLLVTGALALPATSVAADDPAWSTPLALGPTDATSIAARDGLVVAGGRVHMKDGGEVIPAAPRVAGIFRSTDQGRSWTLGRERVVGPDGTFELIALPRTPDLVAVSPAGGDAFALFGGEVWRSEDAGIGWTKVGTIAGVPTATEFLADGRFVVGLGSGGLRVSADRGTMWAALGTGLPTSRVNQVLAYSATLVLVATDTGVYRSADGGATFAQSTQGLAQASVNALGVAGFGTSGLYLAMPGVGVNSTQVYTSSDGTTWLPRAPIYSQNLLPRVNKGAFEVVMQGSLNLIYAGTPVGLLRSSTQSSPGTTWERIEPEPGATAVSALAFEDIDPSPIRNHAVYASVMRASPAVVTNTQVRLAAPGWMDEMEGGRICGGLLSRKDGALFAACGRHVLRSNDGGATWSGAGQGLPYISAGIADTPYNPLVASADGSLWTSGYAYGLYHSNAGVTQWSKVLFPGASVGAIGTHPTDANTVYAAGLLTNGATGVLYKSTDGGTTWGKPVLDVGTSVYNVSVSPSAPSKVLVAAYSAGVWLTEDGGATWAEVIGIPSDASVYRAYFTDASPTRAWALLRQGEKYLVYRSDDAGRTWSEVGEVMVDGKAKSTFEIEVSPWDADTVYSLSIDGDIVVTRDGGITWSVVDGGLPKHPTCSICEEIQNLAFDGKTPGTLWMTAGVLGSGAAPQSMWVYQAQEPAAAG